MTGPTDLPSLPDARFAGLLDEARTLQPTTVALRRAVHRHPEVGLQLPVTQQAVLDALDGLPIETTLGTTTTSVTGVLRGAEPGPAVLLRADMDALPVHEETGLDFASEVPGVMHACGHDTHVAMLAGAARLLSEHVDELAGSVVFMFQPGEEGYHGARHMIHERVLDAAGTRVRSAFAIHTFANLPTGVVTTRSGPVLASADSFAVRVIGKGGHGSMPHSAVDPIPAAAEIVTALQARVTRTVNVFDPAVVSVTRIAGGTTSNVIPESAELEGTIRTLSEHTRAQLRKDVPRVSEQIGEAHGCRVVADVTPGFPVTVTDETETQRVLDLAAEVLGVERSQHMPNPIMGAEDFSYVLQRVPGAFAFLGACPPDLDPAEAPPNHSNRVRYDEAALAHGVAMYAAYALDCLRK
ncbi:M20 metallopeptidase family protein [Saccharomonospora xinjiangensis]|uniref:Amidohydrolase n=1 Tax=Saccharomonospora xinjiangensis XJ-54 TaxID=882086 RepID=I0V3B4_9PSEU|nr:M20 family metallopeptidase [Saccharomonospora xinjiangensis]EID54617.1 amidohydrolase [Saccharomonospora xinjiangensis XJ-54]